jgi:hypothetical protein
MANAPASCVRDPVTGCWTSGAPLHWEQPCVTYSVVAGGAPNLGFDATAIDAIVSLGFSLWPTVACIDGFPSIAVQATLPISCDRPEHNREGPNANAVIFRDGDWPHDPTAVGVTTVTFHPETGKILDVDMEINAFGQPLTTLSLEYVIAHEAGHFFGLDHSSDAAALMFFRYSPFGAEAPPALTPDDQGAICQAYSPARPIAPMCDPEPERGFAPECGGDVFASCNVTSLPRSGNAAGLVFAACAGLGLVRLSARPRTAAGRRRHRPAS